MRQSDRTEDTAGPLDTAQAGILLRMFRVKPPSLLFLMSCFYKKKELVCLCSLTITPPPHKTLAFRLCIKKFLTLHSRWISTLISPSSILPTSCKSISNWLPFSWDKTRKHPLLADLKSLRERRRSNCKKRLQAWPLKTLA